MEPGFVQFLVENFNLTSPVVMGEMRDFGGVWGVSTVLQQNGNLCFMRFSHRDEFNVSSQLDSPVITIRSIESDPALDRVTAATLLAYSIEHIRMNYLISGVSPNRVVNNHFQLVVRAETDEQKNFLSSVGFKELPGSNVMSGPLVMVMLNCERLAKGMAAGRKSRNNQRKKRGSRNY